MPLSYLANPNHGPPGIVVLPAGAHRRAKAEITAWPNYAPAPLRALPDAAVAAGVGLVAQPDERDRFGIGGVGALGAAYAVLEVLLTTLARLGIAPTATAADLVDRRYPIAGLTVAHLPDVGFGRCVAWAASRFGAACEVARDPAEAHRRGWLLVSDHATPGETEVPRAAMQAYRLAADEALDQWRDLAGEAAPTHVFVEGGNGAVAAAISVQLRARLQPAPLLITVEAEGQAALLAAARGEPVAAAPSLLAWQELERSAAAFLAIANGTGSLAGLLAAATAPPLRRALGLEHDSRVLLFDAEGATGAAARGSLRP